MRPDILNPLFAEIETLKGVGPALAKPLERLGLARVVDALFQMPVNWLHRRAIADLDEAQPGETVTLTITVIDYRQGGQRGPFRVLAQDEPGNVMALVFFGRNSGWAKKQLPLGETRIITGKLDRYGDMLQMVHPEVADEGEAPPPADEPVYPLSEGLTNKRMGQIAEQAVDRAPELPEWIEPSLLERRGWPDWHNAIAEAHHLPNAPKARARLGYDEVFANQLAFALLRQTIRSRRGVPLQGDGRLTDKLKLPYSPTGAQSRAISEITGDMAQKTPMLRLLQGDVGSGKTLVALMALLAAVEAGAQGALLAPTEILARQHYDSLSTLLRGVPVNIAVLTGRDKGRVRESTLMGLADGSIDIVIGTHAIFQEAVIYKNLGLAVIDEQHRFGVSQRMLLSAKATVQPHMLAMTATPIPRTLTLTQFGEMDVSILDELPPGRQPIDTRVISNDRIDEVVDGLARHLSGGGQAYWVCPLVEESEVSDQAAAEARYAALSARFGTDRVGLVHGRMKGPEKDAVMARFSSGELGLLVATTVIEVGVDVPNATLMIVEGAERFGLAQLHQLRGRVGRGSGHSVCLLVRTGALSETGRARLAMMRETNDGFRIAEEDLRLRGAGEILGTAQSGEARFKLAAPEELSELLAIANDDARLLLDRDGGLDSDRGQAARMLLYLFERDAAFRMARSG